MLLGPRPNRILRRLHRNQRLIVSILALLFFLDSLYIILHRPRTLHAPLSPPSDITSTSNTTVFIVSVHRNTALVLPAWSNAILDLITHLGASNVYFSALESGSQDDTKDMLTQLQHILADRGVPASISLGMTVWEQVDEIYDRPPNDGPRQPGWIWDRDEGHWDMRRIPYLANVRNRAMEPLYELERDQGRRFDKVLWVNDVVFDTQDFVTLLNTREGRYAAACGMDYKAYPVYYDTFALRDDQGRKAASQHWPWFMPGQARESAKVSEPIAVKSCWNGLVLMDAAPFYESKNRLQFRGVPDSLADLHLEGSECCLIHADNPLSQQHDKGVWLNPNVRVGYDETTYRAVRRRHGSRFPGAGASVVGAWSHRWQRWTGAVQQKLEMGLVMKRLMLWKTMTPKGQGIRHEPGDFCLINEMQIMWENGWKHL